MLSSTLRPLARCALTSTQRISLRVCTAPRLPHAPFSPRLVLQRRTMGTPAPQVNESALNVEEYHSRADHTMERLLDRLEELLDASGESDWEVDYHSGVLTLQLGANGTYVINKQPPNKQIWLSSPKSGPKRYDYDGDSKQWTYLRDGQTIDTLLSEELSAVFDQPLMIDVRSS